MSDIDVFRTETRSWLEANCPAEMREPVRDEERYLLGRTRATFKNDAQKAWFEVCRDKGYTVPAWPKEYGGAGLNPAEAKVLRQEMPHWRAPAAFELRHLDARPGAAAIRHRGPEAALPQSRSRAVKSAGVRAIQNRAAGLTSFPCRPLARMQAITGS